MQNLQIQSMRAIRKKIQFQTKSKKLKQYGGAIWQK